MSGYLVSDNRKVTTHRFMEMKQKGEKISMLTSYDYTMAGLVDKAGIDAILVGDSASNVMAGNATTLPMTVDYMIYHARSVVRAVQRALVVCDMPFGSYQVNAAEGVTNAIRIMKESGCDALKMEGGVEILDTVKRILDAGIPVMAHLGERCYRPCGGWLFRHYAGEGACPIGCGGDQDRQVPHYRYRCRQWLRRTGVSSGRHAGYDARLLSAFPAPLCRLEHRDYRCCGSLCGRCQTWRLP